MWDYTLKRIFNEGKGKPPDVLRNGEKGFPDQ